MPIYDRPAETCGACASGWVTLEVAGTRRALRCLCPLGAALARTVPTVGQVLDAAALAALYPEGTPTPGAGFPHLARAGLAPAMQDWTLASYRTRFGDDPKVRKVLASVELWLDEAPARRTDLVLFGPNGTGKTGLAVALLRAALDRGEGGRFWRADALWLAWRACYDRDPEVGGEREPGFFAKLVETPLLVLDEAGAAQRSEWVEQNLTMLVDARQKALRPTVLTLNLGADVTGREAISRTLVELFGPALMDRFRELAQFWQLGGASRRPTLAKKEATA